MKIELSKEEIELILDQLEDAEAWDCDIELKWNIHDKLQQIIKDKEDE